MIKYTVPLLSCLMLVLSLHGAQQKSPHEAEIPTVTSGTHTLLFSNLLLRRPASAMAVLVTAAAGAGAGSASMRKKEQEYYALLHDTTNSASTIRKTEDLPEEEDDAELMALETNGITPLKSVGAAEQIRDRIHNLRRSPTESEDD